MSDLYFDFLDLNFDFLDFLNSDFNLDSELLDYAMGVGFIQAVVLPNQVEEHRSAFGVFEE